MPPVLPGALFIGIVTVLAIIILRARVEKPRLPVWQMILAGVAAAYVVPYALLFLAAAWRAVPGLPALPTVTGGQVFLGVFATGAALTLTHRPGTPPKVPLWAGVLIGVAFAALFPPLIDRATGRYQNASLRADVSACMQGMAGQLQPREVANGCDFPITVGLCLPGEVNPAPCAQSVTLAPGERASLDPGTARLSSVPANPNGLTVVACRTPDRPSRWGNVTGRGYRGVCLPPG